MKQESEEAKAVPVTCPHIDEAELLADIRSPRFLTACHKLKIDPIELASKDEEEFRPTKGGDGADDIKLVRFAMYERGRLHKWKLLNECRFSLPKPGEAGPTRSRSADPTQSRIGTMNLSGSWVMAEMSKTGNIAEKGRTEVFKSVSKKLKDIASQGRMVMKESNDRERREREARLAADAKRRELIKKHHEQVQRQKEKLKKDREEMAAREQKFKEIDDASKARQKAMYEAWEKESKQKQKEQLEHFERVQNNVERANQEKNERAKKILEELLRKEEQTKRKQEEWIKGGDSGIQEKAVAAERRRQDLVRNQAEQGKQLLVEYKKVQAENERRIAERAERQKEIAKERQQKESQTRKRISDIQKKSKEILKDKQEKILEHMEKVDQCSQEHKAKRKRQQELKAEADRLRLLAAQENMERERLRQAAAAKELDEKFKESVREKRERDELIQQLLKERQLQATAIRLHKDELQEELFQIKVHNSWNKANMLLREMDT